jgi:hypothetical protein
MPGASLPFIGEDDMMCGDLGHIFINADVPPNVNRNTRGDGAPNHLAPLKGSMVLATVTQASGAALLQPVLVYDALSGLNSFSGS